MLRSKTLAFAFAPLAGAAMVLPQAAVVAQGAEIGRAHV